MQKLEINLPDKDYSILKRIAKSEGWQKLDYYERKSKGYEHVSTSLSNHVQSEELGRCHDPLIDPLSERIQSYAVEPITEEVK